MDETIWSLLPDVILNTVFTYLPRTDQASASQVCRNWSRAMDNPNLWRKIDIDLEDATLESLQSLLRFTKRYGHHLRKLTIKYDNVGNPKLERALINLINNIHGCDQLRYFNLQSFKLGAIRDRESYVLRPKFLNAVCHLLKRQHNLSEVVMTDLWVTNNQGNQILNEIAKGSGRTLQILKIRRFFHPKNAVFSDTTYLSILDNFKHLEVVSCDYCCVSEEVILCLAHNCAERLRSLFISCQDKLDVNFQTVGNDTWKQFKKECPNVFVDFEFLNIYCLETLKRLVPCQVPLRSFNYLTTDCYEMAQALNASNLITHVLTNFDKTLENLKLYCDDSIPNVGTVFEQFLPSAKNLKRLVVTAYDISDTFIEKVKAMREQKLIHLSEFRPKKYVRITYGFYVEGYIPDLNLYYNADKLNPLT